MSTSPLHLADFQDLFTGNIHNYGQHTYAFKKEGKEEGKNFTVTSKLLTIEQYRDHLEGKTGLGIIPINSKGECKFGAIDLDVYDDDLSVYIDAIESNNIPLIPFRSKSGGVHLFLFMAQPVQAKSVIDALNAYVTLLGLDIYVKRRLNKIIEVFPKQSRVTDTSMGNWINLPYYNADATRQYAMRRGERLSLEEALMYAKDSRKSFTDIQAFFKDAPFNDGPPCVQTINLLNIMDKNSGRNNYLFHFGVYLKKKDPEFWEQQLFEVNAALKSPLPKAELEATIINSLRKKEYTYKCLEMPCVDFCRKQLCKKREFGIGKEGGYFSELEYGKLVQIKSYEPYYEWEVKPQGAAAYILLRFKNEDEIIKQDAFMKLCFRELHILPVRMKQSEWFKIVNQALKEVEVKKVEQDEDTSPIVLFKSLFLEFLLEHAPAQTRDQILNKRTYFDKDAKLYYFRSSDLAEFIFVSKNFRFYVPGELHALLHDFNAIPTRVRTETGKQLRVYSLSHADLDKLMPDRATEFKAKFEKEEEQF